MSDTWDYVRKEWAKVEEEGPGPRVRITDICCASHSVIRKIPGKGPIPERTLEEFEHAFAKKFDTK